MLKFRKLLLCDYFYYGIFVIAILVTIIQIHMKKTSYYSADTKEVFGVIVSIQETEEKTIYQIKAKELLMATSQKTNTFSLGDTVKVRGNFQQPISSNDKNLWNYQEYLSHKKIYYIVQIETMYLVKSNHNVYYKLKQILINHLHKNAYLKLFILGDKSMIDSDVLRSYQENGISHLFAISGMHISLLAGILDKILQKKTSENKRYYIISLFLVGYLFLVGFSPSIVRGVGFYIMFQGNHIYYFYIKKENLFLFVLSIALLLNPFFIYDVGFQYSYFISYALLKMSSKLSLTSKWKSLFQVSVLSFFVGIPISLYHFNQLNLFSIVYNLFYVPYVTTIVFPFSILTFLCPYLEPFYHFSTYLLEITSLFLVKIHFGKFIWKQVPSFFYYLYFFLIFLYLVYKRKLFFYCFCILLIIHYFLPFFNHNSMIKVLDVGQGDSTFIRVHQKNILIDTGGKGNQGFLYYNVLHPILKKEGVQSLDYLILTHGDFDHMGESIKLVENFKVEKVIFNCGEYNDLEKDLIKVLKKKKIPYYSCIKELNIDNTKLYFLQTDLYDNENDNSNVIYTEIKGYKFMFMGDAGVEKEKDILEEYDINHIDVLKVGHHGSKTSSSESFINEINPKYSIISVGKNNRYGHPNKEVLNILDHSKIYRTDQDGSIIFKIKNNKLCIETSAP